MQPSQSPATTGRSIDWEYLRYLSDRYFTLGRVESESWQSVALRIGSFATVIVPATIGAIHFIAAPSEPESKVCCDFKDVLANWRKVEKGATPEPYSVEEALSLDMGRSGILFFDGQEETNKTLYEVYLQRCKGIKKPLPNLSPEVRRYGTQMDLRSFLLESTQGFFLKQGFNREEGALLALKAYYLLTPVSGAERLVPTILERAEKEGCISSQQLALATSSSNPLKDFIYRTYEKFTWRHEYVAVIDKVPYLIVQITNFLPKSGIWRGQKKTIAQENYFFSTAKFNLLKDVDRPQLNHIPQNELLFDLVIENVSDDSVAVYYDQEDAANAIRYIQTGSSRYCTSDQGCFYRML